MAQGAYVVERFGGDMSAFPHLPFLDRLRPEAGWKTDRAVISTYSAQMPVIAAVLLAMAGEVDEAGSGSRVGLVRALMTLRRKVHVVLQSGRLTQGPHDTAIGALFDQFLLQVPWDETPGQMGQSWHAKFVLVRQVPEAPDQQSERWIFMLGSRNLTKDTSWDIGFSLEGCAETNDRPGHASQHVDGIARLVGSLAGQFPTLKSWSRFEAELRETHWQVPMGLKVTDLQLLLPENQNRGFPTPPDSLHSVIAVSPFLDKSALDNVMRWPLAEGHASRQLLSTRVALARVLSEGELRGCPQLLALAEPTFEEPDIETSTDDAALEPENIGLHAKMILAEHAAGSTLWLGSPNLTRRAWTRNAEIFVRVDSSDNRGRELLRDGVNALLELAVPVTASELQMAIPTVTIEERLAAARNHVAARLAKAKQRCDVEGHVSLECADSPHPVDPDCLLKCGQIKGEMAIWRAGERTLAMLHSVTAVQSDLVNCRLELEGAVVAWVQVIPFDPPLDINERDAKVLSEYLGSQQMLSWIHSVLSGYSDGDGGGGWDKPRHPGRRKGQTDSLGLPTLEQALRMWLKDPLRLDEVDQILALRRKIEAESTDTAHEHLDQFAATWKVIRAGLRGVAS